METLNSMGMKGKRTKKILQATMMRSMRTMSLQLTATDHRRSRRSLSAACTCLTSKTTP